jgi:ribulose-5-phosphate 4-epimerase/fuculose-1-phosphate aldolase
VLKRIDRYCDGNISIRLDEDRFRITPTGLYKRRLRSKQILVVDKKGKLISGKIALKPSSELLIHMETYRQRRHRGCTAWEKSIPSRKQRSNN